MAVPAWVKTALPIAGLGALPLVGLLYVAFLPSTAKIESSPAVSPSSTTAAISAADLPDSSYVSHPGEAKEARMPSRAGAAVNRAAFSSPQTSEGRDAAKHLCCEKLTDLQTRAEVSVRPTFQAAAAACNAASTNDDAYQQVARIMQGTSAAVPSECQKR